MWLVIKKHMATRFTFPIPGNVSEETAKFMKAIIRELRAKQKLDVLDSGALNMLMTSYEMYLQATEKLLDEGPVTRSRLGDDVPNPAQTIASKNYNQVLAIMKEYGLTVKSRAKMKDTGSDEQKSALEEFLASKKK